MIPTSEEKLSWTAQLSGLLLNEATDVVRWFVLDNLPRARDQDTADLNEILISSKDKLAKLLNTRDEQTEDLILSQEFYDILYPPDGSETNVENYELALLLFLIKYLCEFKHLHWKYWWECPQPHQTTPLFHVLRMCHFKSTKMKGICYDYEIDKEIFTSSFQYLTRAIDGLNGYKYSTRRWGKRANENVKIFQCEELVSVMRWQTLTMKKRKDVYLIFKDSWIKKMQNNNWSQFLGHFGQMKQILVTESNLPKWQVFDDSNFNFNKLNDEPTKNVFLQKLTKQMHWNDVKDENWKKSNESQGLEEKRANNFCTFPPMVDEKNNLIPGSASFVFGSKLENRKTDYSLRKWKSKVIADMEYIRPLALEKGFFVHLDNVAPKLIGGCPTKFVCISDIYRAFVTKIEKQNCVRCVICGDPSSGKSTTLHKIAYDWCSKNSRDLAEIFDAVFYIDLAKVPTDTNNKYQTLSSTILNQCVNFPMAKTPLGIKRGLENDTIINQSDVEQLLQDVEKRALFIFDNLDYLLSQSSLEMSDFSDIFRDHLYQNSSFVITTLPSNFGEIKGKLFNQTTAWLRYDLASPDTTNMKQISTLYFQGTKQPRDQRDFLNKLRIYHRDVYCGKYCDYVIVSFMCHVYALGNGLVDFTQPLPQLIHAYFQTRSTDILGCWKVSKFSKHLLHVTQTNIREIIFPWHKEFEYDDNIEMLKNENIVQLIKNEEGRICAVKFLHRVFLQYFAALTFNKLESKGLGNFDFGFEHMFDLDMFYCFCALQDHSTSETILEDLIDAYCRLTAATELPDEIKYNLFTVAVKLLAMSQVTKTRSFGIVPEILNIGTKNRKGGIEGAENIPRHQNSILEPIHLEFKNLQQLTSADKNFILYFVACCQQLKSNSGTVFPFLTSSTLTRDPVVFVNQLTIHEPRDKDTKFVSMLVQNLPTLQSFVMLNVRGLSTKMVDSIFGVFCETRGTFIVDKIKISMASERFSGNGFPSYTSISNSLPHLPYLDTLELDIRSFEQLKTIFLNKDVNCTVPIRDLSLTKFNIREAECEDVSSMLQRTKFLENFNLSHNPIYNGLQTLGNAMYKLTYLKNLVVESCCLSDPSLMTLSRVIGCENFARSLEVLNLRGNYLKNKNLLMQLSRNVATLGNLRVLDVSENFLGNRVICSLANSLRNCLNLEKLFLEYVHMDELGLSAIKTTVGEIKYLKALHVGRNLYKVSPLEILSDIHGGQKLEEIALSGISQEKPNLHTSKSVRCFADGLSKFRNLYQLDLRNNVLKYEDLVNLLVQSKNDSTPFKLLITRALCPLSLSKETCWKNLEIS